jgi:hypothetical protein
MRLEGVVIPQLWSSERSLLVDVGYQTQVVSFFFFSREVSQTKPTNPTDISATNLPSPRQTSPL